jgi:hypothetical protein
MITSTLLITINSAASAGLSRPEHASATPTTL